MAAIAHPPHLQEESMTGSSFIPFCAYKTNMTISGPQVLLSNISFPICTAFKPTVLEGQLCYKIQVNVTGGQGKKNGLSLLLDYQDELSLQAASTKDEENGNHHQDMDFDTVAGLDAEAAKVHIDTLSPFVGFGGGIYQMTVVKRMTATDDFLKMPLKERNCKVELFENCRTRKLLERCTCVPGEMPEYQVRTLLMFQINCLSAELGKMQPGGQGLY